MEVCGRFPHETGCNAAATGVKFTLLDVPGIHLPASGTRSDVSETDQTPMTACSRVAVGWVVPCCSIRFQFSMSPKTFDGFFHVCCNICLILTRFRGRFFRRTSYMSVFLQVNQLSGPSWPLMELIEPCIKLMKPSLE